MNLRDLHGHMWCIMSIFDRAKCLHDEHEWLLENSERLEKDKMVLDAKLREVIIFLFIFSNNNAF